MRVRPRHVAQAPARKLDRWSIKRCESFEAGRHPENFDPEQPFFSILSLFDLPNTAKEFRASAKITL